MQKDKAIKKFYKIKLDWLETNSKTHYKEAFIEIDKWGQKLVEANIFKEFKIKNDAKMDTIKERFRADLDKALREYNAAFKDWCEESKNNE